MKGGMKKYRIHLTPDERSDLEVFVAAGKAAATKRRRAQILLAADASRPGGGCTDEEISRVLEVDVSTIERTRCALCEHGMQIALHGWPAYRKVPRSQFDATTESHLVVAACSQPPTGASRWTLHLLRDRLVELKIVEGISESTVGRLLKKRNQTLAGRKLVHSA
jgi:CHAD domain-containing protein